MNRHIFTVVACCATGILCSANAAFSADVQSSLGGIQDAIIDRPDLHGSWVLQTGLDASQDRALLTIITDAADSRGQEQRLRAMLESSMVGLDYQVTDVVKLPMRHLIARLNVEMEADPSLDGCLVDGATYVTSKRGGAAGTGRQGILIRLYGRVEKEKQAPMIPNLCAEFMSTVEKWQDSLAKTELSFAPEFGEAGFAVQPGDMVRGRRFFGDGVRMFNARCFAEARAYFRSAIVESPRMDDYRYWRVLSVMETGDQGLAYEIMLSMARRGELSASSFSQVQRSLERVQGRRRMDLIDLESRARQNHHLQEIYRRDMYRKLQEKAHEEPPEPAET